MIETNEVEARVAASLKAVGVPYEVIACDPEFADTAVFCEKYGYRLEDSGNTIVVASKRGTKKYSACVVRGSDRLDVNRTVRKLMGVPRASFASAEEVIELTGMMIGGVTPFALPDDLPVYVDRRVMDLESVIVGSGSRSSKILVSPEALARLPNGAGRRRAVEVGDGVGFGSKRLEVGSYITNCASPGRFFPPCTDGSAHHFWDRRRTPS